MTPKLYNVVHILIKKFNAVKGGGGAISTHRNETPNSCLSCYVVLNRVFTLPVKIHERLGHCFWLLHKKNLTLSFKSCFSVFSFHLNSFFVYFSLKCMKRVVLLGTY